MDTEDTTRWTITVSKSTDTALRAFLAQRGLEEGELSWFIQEAVNWRLLDLTAAEIRAHNHNVPPEQLETEIEEAVAAVRAERYRERQAKAAK